jgi:hypothetical protein
LLIFAYHGRGFGNPMIAKNKLSQFVKGDITIMDREYRNGRNVVAAEIGVGSAVQHPVNEAF